MGIGLALRPGRGRSAWPREEEVGGEREGSGGVWSESGERESSTSKATLGLRKGGARRSSRPEETEGKGQCVTRGEPAWCGACSGGAQRMPGELVWGCTSVTHAARFWLDGMR